MDRIFAIVKKELLDALRDRKSLSTALLAPILFAVFTFGMPSFLVNLGQSSETVSLPVVGAERIVPLVDYLEEHGVEVIDPPDDPEQAIIDKSYDMVLVVPEDFGERFRNQKIATLNLLSDHSRNSSYGKVGKVRFLIQQWSSTTGAMRLITRGVSPEISNPINLAQVNVTSQSRLAAQALSMLPMFIMLITFVSGVGMISDMASGERERKSLEPLMANPISTWQLFGGKLFAAAAVTLGIAIFGTALQFVGVYFAPIAELGFRINLNFQKFLLIILLLTPLVFLASAMQLLVSFFARSFKDAQTYNTFFSFIPMAPGMYFVFKSATPELWQMFVPILGQTTLLAEIIFGETFDYTYMVIVSLQTIIIAVISAFLGVTLLRREKTVFG